MKLLTRIERQKRHNIKNRCRICVKKELGFGKEFYLTTFENQAKKWAVRKGMRQENFIFQQLKFPKMF